MRAHTSWPGWLLVALLAASGTAQAVPPPCPHVVVVVDASESMQEDVNGRARSDPAYRGPSKFELSQQYVVNFIKVFGDVFPVGMASASAVAASSDEACASAARLAVPAQREGAAPVLQALRSIRPAGKANLGEVVDAALADAGSAPGMGHATHLILLTDGKLGCNSGDTPDGDFTVARVAHAQAAGLTTFVVGLGEAARPDVLQRLAVAGGKPASATCERDGTPCYDTLPGSGDLDVLWTKRLELKNSAEGICDATCRTAGCPVGEQCVVTEFNREFHCEAIGGPGGGDAGAAADGAGAGLVPAERGCSCRVGPRDVGGLEGGPLVALLILVGWRARRGNARRKAAVTIHGPMTPDDAFGDRLG